MKRLLVLIALIAVFLFASVCFVQADEYRAMWSNAWGAGFLDPGQTTTMMNYTRDCRLNIMIPEIRRGSDAYYTSTIEPRGVNIQAGYDALADIITKGHPDIEIHPWVVTFRIWSTSEGPGHSTPEHLWYTHGPGGPNDWTMLDTNGNWDFGGVSNIDPGHPAVEDYLITVFMDIINRYDVDGFNLDYIRYPGTGWGYNPVAVARFNAEYGTSGNPSFGDPTWQEWRRDQISNLVKRLYLEIKTVKPWVKLGIAGWNTAGSGNSGYLQDWNKWMQKHWLDYCSPMTYTNDNDEFHTWMHDAQGRQYGHHIYPLVNLGYSLSANVLPQIDLVREHSFPGLGLYCYQSTFDKTAVKNALVAGPFPTAVAVPDMPWLSAPTKGYLKGYVRNTSGNAIYPTIVTIVGPGTTDKNSGTGFYGFSEVTPGSYTVSASSPGYATSSLPVTISAGAVSDLDFVLTPSDTTPPVITNVRAENVQATNVQLKWDTDEAATSQVDYGLTTGYGTTTPEDIARVTSHVVQLTGLSPLTQYHYRVRSYDFMRNMAQSTDFTFTTGSADIPGTVIIDNLDSACTTNVAWFTGTGSTDKYGINYYYCSIAGGTKTCTWRPNMIVAGNYDIFAWWPEGTNRTPNAPYIVQWNGGSGTYPKDQRTNGGKWNLLVANRPLAVGTAGYVRVSNTGIEPTNVMADAIKIEPADTEVPTTPTNLTATTLSTTQIALSWSPSTDNRGVIGYKIYRGGVEVGTSTTTSYTDSGRAANTQYSYYVKAYDLVGNLSAQSNTANRYTLSAAPGGGSVTCDKTVNTWQSSPTFTFTAVGGFGAGKIQYYKYAFTQNPTHSWTGFEPAWSSGTSAQTATSSGSWYFHVKGFNAENAENGNYTYWPYKYDSTAPVVSNLNDYGPYTDVTGQLHATWTGSDPETGVMEYQYAIGTDPGNLGTWTSTGTGTSFTTTGLTLDSGTTYYVGVKGQNGAGTWSTPVVSTGVTAANVVASIVAGKGIADGDAVILTDRVVSADFGTYFYICDGQVDQVCGIRVNGPSPDEGRLADVSGILGTINGERVLTAPDMTDDAGPGAPSALFMINRSVGGSRLNDYTDGITGGTGLNNIGLLIAVVGQVYDGPTGYFLVGGTEDSLMIKVDASMLSSIPETGRHVRVIGICSTEESGGVVTPVVIPRGDGDIAKYPP